MSSLQNTMEHYLTGMFPALMWTDVHILLFWLARVLLSFSHPHSYFKKTSFNCTVPPAHFSFTFYLPPSLPHSVVRPLLKLLCFIPRCAYAFLRECLKIYTNCIILCIPLWCFWDFSMLICFNYSIIVYLNKSVYSSSRLREGQDGSTFSLCSKYMCACLLRKRCWRLSKASI